MKYLKTGLMMSLLMVGCLAFNINAKAAAYDISIINPIVDSSLLYSEQYYSEDGYSFDIMMASWKVHEIAKATSFPAVDVVSNRIVQEICIELPEGIDNVVTEQGNSLTIDGKCAVYQVKMFKKSITVLNDLFYQDANVLTFKSGSSEVETFSYSFHGGIYWGMWEDLGIIEMFPAKDTPGTLIVYPEFGGGKSGILGHISLTTGINPFNTFFYIALSHNVGSSFKSQHGNFVYDGFRAYGYNTFSGFEARSAAHLYKLKLSDFTSIN